MAATGTKPWGYWKCAAGAECGYETSGARSEVSGRVENICSRKDCPAWEEFSKVAVYDDGREEFGPSHIKVGGKA